MAGTTRELEGIIGAIREVEVNLDRRDARAYGAVLIMWALVGGGCLLYAQSPAWFPEHHEGHTEAFMSWFWTLPFTVAGIVSLFVGARRWRLREETRNDGRLWWLLGALLIPVALTVALLLYRVWWPIPAMWIAWAGVYLLARDWRDDGVVRRTRQAMGVLFLACAIVIAIAQPTWAYVAAGTVLLLGLGGLGLTKYVRGE